MWTHVDRGRGVKNVIFCGRHKWMAPNKENDKPSQAYNILKLYKCIVGLQLEYCIQVVIARSPIWKTEERANKSSMFVM